MQFDRPLRRLIFGTGTAAFAAMLFGSLFFWKERMFFTDAAYHLFYIVARDGYAIQNSRFVALLTQSFPLFASRMQLPLDTVAKMYSLSFPLLYLLSFWMLCLVQKNYKVALAYLLLSFLMTRASFYWCLSELIQGFAFLFLYLGFLLKGVENNQYLSLPVRLAMWLCMLAVVFSHPIILFSVGFVFLFFLLHYPAKRLLLIREGLLFTGLIVLKGIVFRNTNDRTSAGSLLKGLRRFPHYWDMPSNQDFLSFLMRDYYWVALLFLAGLLFYARRNPWKLALLFFSFTGFVFLNNLAAPDGSGQFYIENRYMGICLFVVLPFVWDILPQLRLTRLRKFLLPLALASCLLGIFRHHRPYTERLALLRGNLEEMRSEGGDKWIVPVERMPISKMMMLWGVSYEAWLLSTCEYGQTYSFIVRMGPLPFDQLEQCNTCFGTQWESPQYETLPARYFILKHRDFPYTNH